MVKEILESTPSGMKDLDSSKETPSVNPFPSEFYCKTNMCWNSEHAKVPCCKLIASQRQCVKKCYHPMKKIE